jgi:hypothetical protein
MSVVYWMKSQHLTAGTAMQESFLSIGTLGAAGQRQLFIRERRRMNLSPHASVQLGASVPMPSRGQ